MTLTLYDWRNIGLVVCLLGAAISAGLGNLGRDQKMKWGVTNDKNRVAGFFFALFIVAGGALFMFGPKGP